jgi:hypothetical protein
MGMSVPTDSTVKASASGRAVELDDQALPSDFDPAKEILVFVCYRDEDGKSHADWINRALNGWQYALPDGSTARVRTYFAGTAPAVGDWTQYHLPSLQTAKSLIVVCTPGAARDFSAPGKPDWVYEELRWWIAHRAHPPIVVDVSADGAKWVPEPILQKWPKINRVPLRLTQEQLTSANIDERYRDRWRQQIEHTLHESERASTFEDLAERDRLNAKLQRRAKILTAALVIAAVAAGFSLRSYTIANNAYKSSRELNRFLGGLFYHADPDQTRGASLTAGELLETGVNEAKRSAPAVRIDMQTAIGAAYTGLGENEKAVALLDETAQLAKQHGNISEPSQFNLALAHGEALLYVDRFNDARGPLARALQLSEDGPDRSRTLVVLGDLEAWAPNGDRKLAAERYRQAIAIDSELKDQVSEARDHNRLGYLAKEDGDYAAATQQFSAASSLVHDPQAVAGSLLIVKYDHDLAALQYEHGDFRGALKSFELAREEQAKAYGEDSSSVAIADNNIARLTIEQGGDLADAEKRLTRAAATLETKHGADFADLSKVVNSLGLVQRERGDRAGARSNFERARKIAEANSDHPIAAQALIHLAEMSTADGNLAAAKGELDQAFTHFADPASQQGWRFGLYQGALAALETANCEFQKARTSLDESDLALSKRWSWPNIFRHANEQRRAQLTTMQNNDTARCRGAAPYVPAKQS